MSERSAVGAGLAERQAELVAALTLGGPEPAGFDPARLAALRKALLRKRAGEAARQWPVLAAALGDGWGALAVEVLAGKPVVGGLQDGWDLARAAAARGPLSEGAARELRERERALRYDGVRPPVPRLRTRLRGVLPVRSDR